MSGQLISQYLQNNGIKQRWLAEQLGITESRLSLILAQKAPLDAEILFKICDTLGVSSELFRPIEG